MPRYIDNVRLSASVALRECAIVLRAPVALIAIPFVACTALTLAYPYAGCAAACGGVTALAWRRARGCGAAVIAAYLSVLWHGAPVALDHDTRTARWSGTVIGDVRAAGNAFVFPLALDDGITVEAALTSAVAPGERLVLRGRLSPFDEARNPGEPSRRAIAVGEGLAGRLAGATLLSRAPYAPFDPRGWAARARAALSRQLRALIAEPEATVVAGALWGERGTLPSDLRADFQATGTVHVLVTAGLHLGVVAGLVLCILRWCAVGRIAAGPCAIVCVIGYAWLSGGHLPSQRAAVMVCVALIARACGARSVSWNALGLAAIAIALLWPASIATVSFALSFSCVIAIGLFARPLEHMLAHTRLPRRIQEALALTMSTQIGVWPLSAATFGLVAPYAIAANAFVVPATGIAMLAAIAALALSPLPAIAWLPATLAQWDVDAILRVVTAIAALPGARVSVAPPPTIAIIVYDVLAVAAAALLARAPRTAIALLVAASAGVLVTTVHVPDGRLTITMLDVGQGDGIVVRTPQGHVVLIDSGGRLERGPSIDGASPAELVGERIVVPYLQRAGISHVDLLLNTHPHGDHVGGFAPVVRALRVDAVADSGQTYGGRAFSDGLRAAAVRRVPVTIARCGDVWSSGDGVTLSILSPCGALVAGPNSVNENSIVALLRYRTFRMLFTGDAGFATEQRLLRAHIDLRADVLKVGHHGSAYASGDDFIAAVRPRYALISVGRHNLFGHPSPGTLWTLGLAGSEIIRTDRCGAITIAVTERVDAATMIPCSTATFQR